MKLTKNIKVYLKEEEFAGYFSEFSGEYSEVEDMLAISNELCTAGSTVEDLIEKIYSDIGLIGNKFLERLLEKAILKPKNEEATLIFC